MDFGLDKLVEMIEERFGRFAGTVVLAAIGVGAFAFAIHALFAFLILPVFRNAPDFLSSLGVTVRHMTAEDWARFGFQMLFMILAALVFSGVARFFLRRIQASTRDIIKDAKEVVSECKAFTDKNHASLGAAVKGNDPISPAAEVAVDRRD